jgi:hypothetical protein
MKLYRAGDILFCDFELNKKLSIIFLTEIKRYSERHLVCDCVEFRNNIHYNLRSFIIWSNEIVDSIMIE